MSCVVEPHATSKFDGGHLVLAGYCSVAPSPSVACSKVVARASMAWLFHWLPCYPSFPPSPCSIHPSPFSSMCVEYGRGRAADASGVMSVAGSSASHSSPNVRARKGVRPPLRPPGQPRPDPKSVRLATVRPVVVVSRQPHSVAFRWPASKSPSLPLCHRIT